jgi:hypothetical protein
MAGFRILTADDNCTAIGVDETIIWKGKAGSNEPLETPFENLPSTITSDMTLSAGKTYGLNGKVNVQSPAVLTIEAGVTVAGVTSSSFMIIEPGAQLIAIGTQAEPIVFTSKKDVDGYSADNKAGEWGGLVLAGNAYTHYGVTKYEADETVEFGSAGHTRDTDSSGDLEYVVIKHTGYEVEKDKELNGLSLAAVGSNTVLENIAIIGGLDDGLEIWGGTPDITGLYVYNANDDSVDTDLGYRGKIENVLVQQVNVDSPNTHDSAGMEFGNDNNTIVTDDTNATKPHMVNYTGYIKGGGFYTKNDAGATMDNVKFISAKTTDVELMHFRSSDAFYTDAINLVADLCLNNTDATKLYTTVNSKDTNTSESANAYYTDVTKIDMGGFSIQTDTSCAGADEANIWKGKAGSNDPLEVPAP